MFLTNRPKAYAVAALVTLAAASSGVVLAEDSQSATKEVLPAVDASKVLPPAGVEQKKVLPGQVGDLSRSAALGGQQLPASTPDGAGSSLPGGTSDMPVPSSPSSSGGGFFSSLGSFLQNLVRVDVRDKGGKANVDVKAPFVNVQDAGKGDSVNVKAPFVDVQGKGDDANVNVNAPFVDVHVNKGQSKVRVKTPFFELNK